jgi:quercetin dioxygenase-like cupin family protein
VVLKGSLTFTYADRQEVVEAGEAYYAEPGHTPSSAPGTEIVEFSPTHSLEETMAVVMKNVEAMAAQA